MTIATTLSSVTAQGNGATTLFNYDFLIPDATDVVIVITDTTVNPATTTTLTTSQYAITGIDDSDGGQVQYPLSGSPLAAGEYITISRILPLVQTTQISNQGAFYPEVIEAQFDYQMMCIQQLSTQIAAASFPSAFTTILGQSPIVISQSGGQYVASLSPITASSISNSAVITAKLADGAATLAKLDRTGTSASVLTAQGAGNAPIWTPLSATPGNGGGRQTALFAATDSNGAPNYISAGSGLSVNVAATSVPIYLTAANGFASTGAVDRIGVISADTSVSGLTDNTTNYIYADIASNGSCTLGKTTLSPQYRWPSGGYSTTNGQFTFSVTDMVGKVGNGSTSTQTYRVFLAQVVTSGGAVTSVVNYALRGMYRSASTATLPSASTLTTFAHNIGTVLIVGDCRVEITCTTTDNGYGTGEVLKTYATGSPAAPIAYGIAANRLDWPSGGTTAWSATPRTGGAMTGLTLASWSYQAIVNRGW